MQHLKVADMGRGEARPAAVDFPCGRRFSGRRIRLFGLGLLGLAAGFLYYAVLRHCSPALVRELVGGRLYGAWPWLAARRDLLTSFPSFIHVFSFSLLTVAVRGRAGVGPCLAGAALWTGIDVAFECLQGIDHAAFARFMAGLPWRLEGLTAFVTGGVFDTDDVWAAVSGGAVAFVLSLILNVKGADHAA